MRRAIEDRSSLDQLACLVNLAGRNEKKAGRAPLSTSTWCSKTRYPRIQNPAPSHSKFRSPKTPVNAMKEMVTPGLTVMEAGSLLSVSFQSLLLLLRRSLER